MGTRATLVALASVQYSGFKLASSTFVIAVGLVMGPHFEIYALNYRRFKLNLAQTKMNQSTETYVKFQHVQNKASYL